MRFRCFFTLLFFTTAYFFLCHLTGARPAFHLYNDDLGWLAVMASQQSHSLQAILTFTWTRHSEVGAPVLNLFLTLYFALFGNTSAYLLPLTVAFHVLGSASLLWFLNEIFPNQFFRNAALTALYCLGFPHFHSYLWAVSFQHLYFLLTHFSALALCLRAMKTPIRFPRTAFFGFTVVFLLASLGRTSFWFTWASVLWLLLTSEERAFHLRRFAPLLVLTLLYPFLESYDGTWGSQVERLAQSFWWSRGLLKAYRSIPFGWLVAWLLFSPLFIRLLRRKEFHLPNEKIVRRTIVGSFALVLTIHAFQYREDLFFVVISYVKYLYPSLHESSPAVLLRWQPIPFAVTHPMQWLVLSFCVLFAPLLTWWTLRRLGLRAAILFLPIIPSLFYLRTMGGGGFIDLDNGADNSVHYYVISRYLLYFAPWTLLSLSTLIPQKVIWERAWVVPFLLLLIWHVDTLHDRLERTALSEASTHFSTLIPESLRYAVENRPEQASVAVENIEAKLSDDNFSERWKLPQNLPAELFLWHLNRESPDKFHYANAGADFHFCGTGWCDKKGHRVRGELPLVAKISLKAGQSQEQYLKNVGARSWQDWILTCWQQKKFNPQTKQLLLDDLLERDLKGW